jgi:GAF domain-containing protein
MPAADTHAPDRELQQALAQTTRRAEILQYVVEAVGSGLALEPLLSRIVSSGVELIGARHGSIGLCVETRDGPVMRTAAIHNMPAHELGAENGPGVGMAGRILLDPRPFWVDRYGALDNPTVPEYLDHAVIAVPIWWGKRLIGFIGVGDDAPRRFDQQDADTLALFSQHIAIAIENARLFAVEQQRAARNAMITRVGRLITSSLNIAEVLQTAADAVHEQLRYPDVALFLHDEDSQSLVLRARGGMSRNRNLHEYRLAVGQGIVGAAAQARRGVRVDDVRADPRYVAIPSVPDVQAELAVPILVGERLLGVLNVESAQPISGDDAEDLQLIADQLGVAIDHARRYEDEQRRTERLALIARTGQRITRRLNPLDLFNTLVSDLHERMGYEHAALFLLDAHQPKILEQVACATRWPESAVVGYRQSIDRGIIGAAARQRRPERVADVDADRRYIPMTEHGNVRAELAVPILLGERLLGVLDVASVQPFRDEDVTSLQVLAGQLAVAIDNAELFSGTQRALEEMQLLYNASRQISVAMQVDDVIEAYLREVAARGKFPCTIALYEFDDIGRRSNVVVRGRWTPADGPMRIEARIRYVWDQLDAPLDAGETVAISDVATDERVSAELRAMQMREGRPALAFIPLMVRGMRIGVVILSAGEVYEWRDEDLRPYSTTAAQLATAIDSRQQQSLLFDRGQQLAVLEERQRLARELHDSVTQLVFSTTLIAQSIAPAWRRSPAEGEKRVARLLELSQNALAEMRALLFELRPTPPQSPPHAGGMTESGMPGLMRVQREGLPAAIERYAWDVARDSLNVDVDAHAYPGLEGAQPPLPVEEALFRIAQEAFNNVVKHAQARNVQFVLARHGGAVALSVRDDGKGFDASAAAGGMGCQTMRERAEALHGTFDLKSAPGQGTTIHVRLPI